MSMLLLLLAQCVLGLFSVDVDGIESGPLAVLVSFDIGRLAAETHHLTFYALLALVALHISAISFYGLVKRDNLIGPMITGVKHVSDAATQPRRASILRALALLGAAAGVTYAAAKAFWLP